MNILVVGAGPTGLGACHRLQELGYPNWKLIEAEPSAGGLATSIVDPAGFTWDLGGHVLFSHYQYFDDVMNQLLGEAWIDHIRESWVWMRERFIAYPLQNNLQSLPPEEVVQCLKGLLAANLTKPGKITNFRDWLQAAFGEGLCEIFMIPYNQKVWAFPPETMDVGWMGERVATVDLARVLEDVVYKRENLSWGPNSRFRFPLHGGTGAIWKRLAETLPTSHTHFGSGLVEINAQKKYVVLANGERFDYDRLITTAPLNKTLDMLGLPGSEQLRYSSTHVVGVGIQGAVPDSLKTKCWMYFPEGDSPYYRVTVFSNYSPNNVPLPGQQWSLMAEVSQSSHKPVNHQTIVEDVIEALRRNCLLPRDSKILSRFHRFLPQGYPTPFLGRDQVIGPPLGALAERGIYSRGRFGAWKYEVSNQDHSFMQGVEAVDHILFGTGETTLNFPNIVNQSPKDARPSRPSNLKWA